MPRQTVDHNLYRGTVFHRRLQKPKYTFRYSVFNLLLDIDQIDKLSQQLRFFSHNKFNLFSFYDLDHLPQSSIQGSEKNELRQWVEQGLLLHGIDLKGGRIRLFCFPRVLGFVFNPLSVWYCESLTGELRAILCEVRNTFGERHSYLLHAKDSDPMDWNQTYHHPKRFHVSPFLPVSGEYQFRFSPPGQQLDIGIVWLDDGERFMVATQRMQERPVTDWTLIKTFFSLPLMTLKVVVAIHWQALKIWVRGAQFHRKPKPPIEEISSDG